jgi:hypothetical protein
LPWTIRAIGRAWSDINTGIDDGAAPLTGRSPPAISAGPGRPDQPAVGMLLSLIWVQ